YVKTGRENPANQFIPPNAAPLIFSACRIDAFPVPRSSHSVYNAAAMIKAIDDAVAFIRSKTSIQPRIGVILGSGLGDVVDAVDAEVVIPYGEIPGAKTSSVVGHSGRLVLGHARSTPVGVMQGRIHYYEGH